MLSVNNVTVLIVKKMLYFSVVKIIGVIPARYASTRFPRKPLVDICGYPMIWWVYNQCKKVKEFTEVYVATDDEKIEKACKENGIWTCLPMIYLKYFFKIPELFTGKNRK